MHLELGDLPMKPPRPPMTLYESFSSLWARSSQATLRLRIENLDSELSVKHEEQLEQQAVADGEHSEGADVAGSGNLSQSQLLELELQAAADKSNKQPTSSSPKPGTWGHAIRMSTSACIRGRLVYSCLLRQNRG